MLRGERHVIGLKLEKGSFTTMQKWELQEAELIKRISRVPIYHTRWQHRALYNNTNPPTHTHARTHARTHTRTVSDEGMGRAVKNSLEIVIKQVHLEGGFERGGRIRMAECLRQIVPDR